VRFRRRKRAERHSKACPHCHRGFEARKNQAYCSERCRKATWRENQARRLQALEALVREAGLAGGQGKITLDRFNQGG